MKPLCRSMQLDYFWQIWSSVSPMVIVPVSVLPFTFKYMFPGSSKYEKFSYIDSNIFIWIVQLPLLISLTFAFSFKVSFVIFLDLQIFRKWRERERERERERKRERTNITIASHKKSSICHRMAPLQMLYVMSLTNIFKVTNF